MQIIKLLITIRNNYKQGNTYTTMPYAPSPIKLSDVQRGATSKVWPFTCSNLELIILFLLTKRCSSQRWYCKSHQLPFENIVLPYNTALSLLQYYTKQSKHLVEECLSVVVKLQSIVLSTFPSRCISTSPSRCLVVHF